MRVMTSMLFMVRDAAIPAAEMTTMALAPVQEQFSTHYFASQHPATVKYLVSTPSTSHRVHSNVRDGCILDTLPI